MAVWLNVPKSSGLIDGTGSELCAGAIPSHRMHLKNIIQIINSFFFFFFFFSRVAPVKKKLQNRKLNINEEREPSSCDLDTLGYGGSWMVLPYLFPPSPSLSLSLAPLPLHSLRLRIFNFKLHRVIIRATLILLDTMGRVISYNPIIFKKILN